MKPEIETALDEIKADPVAPLPNAIIRLLLRKPESTAEHFEVLLPCLVHNTWSRRTLREALRLDNAPAEHPAFALLAQAQMRAEDPIRTPSLWAWRQGDEEMRRNAASEGEWVIRVAPCMNKMLHFLYYSAASGELTLYGAFPSPLAAEQYASFKENY